MSRVLASEGANPKVMGYFYKAIIQAVLLHGRIINNSAAFMLELLEDGTYFCPPTMEVLADAGLETIDEYMLIRRQTIRGFVRHRPICDTCRQSRALSTNVNKVVWWTLD